jgi:hypothetical protein
MVTVDRFQTELAAALADSRALVLVPMKLGNLVHLSRGFYRPPAETLSPART